MGGKGEREGGGGRAQSFPSKGASRHCHSKRPTLKAFLGGFQVIHFGANDYPTPFPFPFPSPSLPFNWNKHFRDDMRRPGTHLSLGMCGG